MLEVKTFVDGVDGFHCWLNSEGFKELLSKEIEYRNSHGRDEKLEDWIKVLIQAYNDSVAVIVYKDAKVVGCAMLSTALSLHYPNLLSVTCMLAESNFNTLIKSCILEAKDMGYNHIEFTTKKDLDTFITRVKKL